MKSVKIKILSIVFFLGALEKVSTYPSLEGDCQIDFDLYYFPVFDHNVDRHEVFRPPTTRNKNLRFVTTPQSFMSENNAITTASSFFITPHPILSSTLECVIVPPQQRSPPSRPPPWTLQPPPRPPPSLWTPPPSSRPPPPKSRPPPAPRSPPPQWTPPASSPPPSRPPPPPSRTPPSPPSRSPPKPTTTKKPPPPPMHCGDNNQRFEGVKTIQIFNNDKFDVYCVNDYDKKKPAWTVILRRNNLKLLFNRRHDEYRAGFGKANEDYMLGLDRIHKMTTSMRHELWIHMEDDRTEENIRYDHFAIGNEENGYILQTLGRKKEKNIIFDNFRTQIGNRFSTRYNDYTPNKCAKLLNAGWWFYENSIFAKHNCADIYLTASKRSESNALATFAYQQYNMNYNIFPVQRAFMAIRPVSKTKLGQFKKCY